MSRTVPERAQRLAAELELGLARDAEFATQLNDAQQRLQHANGRLWPGLHPDAVATLYGEHPAVCGIAVAHNRSHILEAPDPLREAQNANWTMHHAFVAYQNAAERRRQLAAELGELAGELITTLVAARWSEHDAKEASVHDLAGGSDNGETR